MWIKAFASTNLYWSKNVGLPVKANTDQNLYQSKSIPVEFYTSQSISVKGFTGQTLYRAKSIPVKAYTSQSLYRSTVKVYTDSPPI